MLALSSLYVDHSVRWLGGSVQSLGDALAAGLGLVAKLCQVHVAINPHHWSCWASFTKDIAIIGPSVSK